MKPIIIPGCSSYYNRKWSEVFYPAELPTKQWFSYYCTQFKTYEINSTFYKFPTVKSLQTWYRNSPQDFKFSVKVPKLITHLNKMIDCEEQMEKFYLAIDGLEEKLGCVLFQFPPSFNFTSERLELIVKNCSASYNNAIEFRHESWWNQEVFKIFNDKKIIFSNVNYSKLPTEIVLTNAIGYLRMHGNPRLFYSEYSTDMLESLINEILTTKCTEFYIYFNNTASTAGIINATEVKNLITD